MFNTVFDDVCWLISIGDDRPKKCVNVRSLLAISLRLLKTDTFNYTILNNIYTRKYLCRKVAKSAHTTETSH